MGHTEVREITGALDEGDPSYLSLPTPTYADETHGKATGSSGIFESYFCAHPAPYPTHETRTFIFVAYSALKDLNGLLDMRTRTIIILEKAKLPLYGIQALRYQIL